MRPPLLLAESCHVLNIRIPILKLQSIVETVKLFVTNKGESNGMCVLIFKTTVQFHAEGAMHSVLLQKRE